MAGKTKEIGYIVPHTHWDREWRYPIWQSRMLLVEFMDRLLEIYDTDPDYKSFVLDGQSVVIEDYLEVRPEKLDKIKKYVKEGRLSIGPWYTLPDLFPIDGECLVRNLLKGIRLSDSFGGHLKIGYNSFGWGQTAQFPQIYQGFGIEMIIAAKNVSKERAPESEFLWEAPDGTRILTTRLGEYARSNFFMNAYIPIMFGMDYLSDDFRFDWTKAGLVYHQADAGHYFQDHFKLEPTGRIHQEKIKSGIEKAWQGTGETTVKEYRLLMNGSDFTTPQPKLTELIQLANRLFEDREFVHTGLEEYAEKLKQTVDYAGLKVVRGELRDGPASSCSSNALASRSYLKRLNKKVQNQLLRSAEPLSVMSSMAGTEYQKNFLDLAVKYLLQAHAHDSINGVTQDKIVNDNLYRLNQALELSEVVSNNACAEIIKRIDTSSFQEKDLLITVFNPSPADRRGVVKVYLDIPREYNVWEFEIVDGDNHHYETQFISRKEEVVPVHEMNSRPWPFYVDRYCFYLNTGDIPACGYKVFKLLPKKSFNRKTVFWPETKRSNGVYLAPAVDTLENDFLKVKVNANGSINISDKTTGRHFTDLNYFEDTGDCGDFWVYYPPYDNRTFTSKGCSARIWLEENGPLSATIGAEVIMKLPARAMRPENGIRGDSGRSDETRDLTLTSRYTLFKGLKRVNVKLKVDNTVEDHRLRVLFDTGINADYSNAAGHFGVDKRPVKPEKDQNGEYYPEMRTMPQQIFVDVSDGEAGLAVINNCFSEFETVNNEERTLAITLFRSVRNIVCSEFRSAGLFEHEKGGQSLGIQEYEYAIIPHRGDWEKAGLYYEAEQLNVPLRLFQNSKHEGFLPLEQSFLSLHPQALVMSACKKAEDRDTFMIRVFNPTGATCKGTLKVKAPIKEAYQVNLNEERLEPIAVDSDNSLNIEAGGHKIITVELIF